jgi:hypothetical protein
MPLLRRTACLPDGQTSRDHSRLMSEVDGREEGPVHCVCSFVVLHSKASDGRTPRRGHGRIRLGAGDSRWTCKWTCKWK